MFHAPVIVMPCELNLSFRYPLLQVTIEIVYQLSKFSAIIINQTLSYPSQPSGNN